MDDKRGNFVEVPREQKEFIWENTLGSKIAKTDKEIEEFISHLDGIFFVGEELEIKGSRFMVKAIHSTRLVLKLLPKK